MSIFSSLFNPQTLIYLVLAFVFAQALGIDVTSLLPDLGDIIPSA